MPLLLKMKFTVTYVDGTKAEVVSRASTEVAFERHFSRTVASLFLGYEAPVDPAEQPRAANDFLANLQSDYLYFLAWHSTKSGVPYDDWLELIDSVSWDFVDEVDPTRPAVSAAQ